MRLPLSSNRRISASLGFAWLLAIALGLRPVFGQSLPANEKQKIEILIKRVEELNDANFIRNGRRYSSATAATFLRRKWRANEAHVKSARDFIEIVGSFSSTSGEPYLIRLKDGKEVKSADFLLAELEKLGT